MFEGRMDRGTSVLAALVFVAVLGGIAYAVQVFTPGESVISQTASFVAASAAPSTTNSSSSNKKEVKLVSDDSPRCNAPLKAKLDKTTSESGEKKADVGTICVPGCKYIVKHTKTQTNVEAEDTCKGLTDDAAMGSPKKRCETQTYCEVKICEEGKPCVTVAQRDREGANKALGRAASIPSYYKDDPEVKKALELAKTDALKAEEQLRPLSPVMQEAFREARDETVKENEEKIEKNQEIIDKGDRPCAFGMGFLDCYFRKPDLNALQEENKKLAAENGSLSKIDIDNLKSAQVALRPAEQPGDDDAGANMTLEEYCKANPSNSACAVTNANAQSAHMTLEEYCKANPSNTACARANADDAYANMTLEEYCKKNPNNSACKTAQTPPVVCISPQVLFNGKCVAPGVVPPTPRPGQGCPQGMIQISSSPIICQQQNTTFDPRGDERDRTQQEQSRWQQMLQQLQKALGGQGQQQKGQGQGGGGSPPPPGNSNPQPTGTCPPTYLCSNNTLYFRNSQCIDQPMQNCQFGCQGNQCAVSPTQTQCPTPPPQPTAQCPSGSWQPQTTQLQSGQSCVVGWQCTGAGGGGTTRPTAKISCQPEIADVGMSVAITFSCENALSSAGQGFFSGGATSGSTSTVITAPPQGANTATYAIVCINGNQNEKDECKVQIARPAISLVANPKKVESGGSSRIGWLTSGMKSCVISSPDLPDFTAENADKTDVSGTATTPPLSKTSRFVLNCTTAGGNTKQASTTVSVVEKSSTLSVKSTIDGREDVRHGSTVKIDWQSSGAPSNTVISLWLYDIRLSASSGLIAGRLNVSGTYEWKIPEAGDPCSVDSPAVCASDLVPGRSYAIEAALYSPPNAHLGGYPPENPIEPKYIDFAFGDDFKVAQ